MWLVIPPQANNARQIWDVEPQPEQVPEGSKILEWKVVDTDNDPYNYSDNGKGETTHTPPAAPAPIVDDTLAAINAWLGKWVDKLNKDQYSELSRIARIQDKAKRDAAYGLIEKDLPR